MVTKMSFHLPLFGTYRSKVELNYFTSLHSDYVVIILQAFRKFDEGNVVELQDPLMKEAVNAEVVMKFLDLAFQCAAPVRADRPDMKSVVQQLWAVRSEYLKSAKRG